MTTIFSIIQLAGVVSILSAFLRLWHIWRFRRRGIRTTGTVIENVPDKGPWILFQDQHGKPQCFAPDFSPSWERAHGAPAGTQVEIVYLPEDPKKVRLLVDTAPINADKTFDGRARRFLYFKVVRLLGHTKRKEDLLRRELRNRGVRTVATVATENTGIRGAHPSGGSPSAYYPRIRFKDQRGELVTFVHKWAHLGIASRRFPAVGEQVAIIYLPESPHVASMAGIARILEDLALRFFVGLLLILFIQNMK
jgi:hypothetical protein